MKRLFKIGWVILIVGLIALAVGYFNGGNKTVNFNQGHPKVITSPIQHLSTNKKFNRVNLNVDTANVVIKQGKKYQVTYYGMGGQIPHISLSGKTIKITQKSNNFQVNFNVNNYDNQDLIVITVPKGKTLKGSLYLHNGDLQALNVALHGMNIFVDNGDVSYNRVSLNGGKTTLSEGDFTARQLTINGHYAVNNDEGDNTVTDTNVDGYYLYTDDGDNELNGEDKGDETLNRNDHAANVLKLTTSEGDNQVN